VPRDTFHNLPVDKRDRLIEIARDEFAAHDYHTASISRIVATMGIAKGSLYQYFEDKQDLYLYLVGEASNTMLEAIAPTESNDGDLFDTVREQMTATVATAARYPTRARLLERAFTANLPFQELIQAQAQATSGTHFARLVESAAERGELNPNLDPGIAAFVIGTVITEVGTYLTARLGLDPHQPELAALASEEAASVFDQVVEALRSGLSTNEMTSGDPAAAQTEVPTDRPRNTG
jgi:AcrR family transcriptional regulator